ncbi:MAG: nitroreductase [Planctomycetaceae bacterium]|nr:nitroreductase [Planctomycetaceae bacterium]
MDTSAINQVIRSRRTVKPKNFTSQDVDQAIIRTMLENANWAPTHGMTEPWRFSIFRGAARQRLAEFLAETYKSLSTPESFKPKKYDGMRQNAMLAPVVIAIGMKRQESEKISELDELLAVACAVENLHLTATAFRLGGFWSTNIAATSDAMGEFLGLKPKDRALGLFYVGYPACEWPVGDRTPIDGKVQWIDR